MKTAKRVFCILLVALTLVTILPITALAAKVTITTQPKTSYTAYGETAKATVKATGDGLKYQWYVKNAGASKFSKSSVTKSTYSVEMTDKVAGRQVYCVVTDAKGNKETSKTVTLRIKATIITEPKTSYTKQGATAKATVVAKGNGLKYEWYYQNAGSTTFKKSSVTSATYSVKMTDKVHGRKVYCVVTDKYGKKDTSATVSLRQAATIVTQPVDVVVDSGETAKVTLKAAGSGLTYTWYYKNPGASSFKKTDSFKGNSYSVEMTSARSGRQVYCVVKDKFGKTAKTNTVTLTMNRGYVNVTTQPVNRDVIAGEKTTFVVAANGSGTIKYQWQYRKGVDGDWANVSASSGKTSKYSLTAADRHDGYQYRCKLTCDGATTYTNTVTLNVATAAAITSQPNSASVMTGNVAAFTVGVYKANDDIAVTYKWQYRKDRSSAWADATAIASSLATVMDANTARLAINPKTTSLNGYEFRCGVTVNGTTTYSSYAVLTVWQEMTISPDPASGNHIEEMFVVVGDQFTLNAQVNGGVAPYTYVWSVSGAGTMSGTSVDGQISYVGTLSAENTGKHCNLYAAECVTASVEVTDSVGNKVNSATYHIHEHEELKITGTLESIKIDPSNPIQTLYAPVSGGNPDFVEYQWQYSMDGNTWFNITEQTSASGGPTHFVGMENPASLTGKTSFIHCISRDDFVPQAVKDNGGVWLRCKVTDTLKGTTVTTNKCGFYTTMTITTSVSGGKVYASVSGGLGVKTYEWRGWQGNWYEPTSNTFRTLEPSRFEEYQLVVTDAAGGKKQVYVNSTTGEVSSTSWRS